MTPKPTTGLFWAYYAPNGYLQVRTISKNKKESGKCLTRAGETVAEYLAVGFVLRRISVNIKEVKI